MLHCWGQRLQDPPDLSSERVNMGACTLNVVEGLAASSMHGSYECMGLHGHGMPLMDRVLLTVRGRAVASSSNQHTHGGAGPGGACPTMVYLITTLRLYIWLAACTAEVHTCYTDTYNVLLVSSSHQISTCMHYETNNVPEQNRK